MPIGSNTVISGNLNVEILVFLALATGFNPDGNQFRKGGDNGLIANNKNPSSWGCGKRYMELKIDFGSGGGGLSRGVPTLTVS